jgi:hypothetical protein
MSSQWRVAKSLDALLAQINKTAPRRAKVSDGSIGDAAHSSRASDHNPHVRDDRMGVVTARDFTHDPKGGLDCHELAASLIEARDARVKYIIWNRQICSSIVSPWQWRPYKGSNPHTKHLHISVRKDKHLYDDERLWAVRLVDGPEPAPEPIAAPKPKPQPVKEAVRSSRTVFGVLTAFGASLVGWFQDTVAQMELLAPVKQIGSGLGLNVTTIVFGITVAGLALALFARLDDAAKGKVVK